MVQLLGWSSLLLTIGVFTLIYALLAIGLNVHFGYTGLLNFGHVAFFAAGAYTAAILTIPHPAAVEGLTETYAIGLSLPMPYGFVASLVLGSVAGMVLAFLIGLPSIRLKSHYLAVVTFALAMIFADMLSSEQWLTRGPMGLPNIPKPGYEALGADLWQVTYFGVVAAITVLVYLGVERLMDAPFGRLLKGIREDETASRMLGKRTNRVKLKSFVLGGGIAGLAGALYAHYLGFIATPSFVPLITFYIWIVMIIGGPGSNKGMVFGAFLFAAFRETTRYLPAIPDYPLLVSNLRWVAIGLLLILFIRLRPQGIFGNINEIVVFGGDE